MQYNTIELNGINYLCAPPVNYNWLKMIIYV